MITIIIKYFGAITDVTHKKEESFHFKNGGSLKDLQAELEQRYPGIQNIPYSVAQNQIIIKQGIIGEGDEITLLPPFAGG